MLLVCYGVHGIHTSYTWDNGSIRIHNHGNCSHEHYKPYEWALILYVWWRTFSLASFKGERVMDDEGGLSYHDTCAKIIDVSIMILLNTNYTCIEYCWKICWVLLMNNSYLIWPIVYHLNIMNCNTGICMHFHDYFHLIILRNIC